MFPSTNILKRTFHLRSGDSTGTCFTMEVRGRQFLVTAAHCLAAGVGTNVIQVLKGSDWISLACRVVSHADVPDIAVLALEEVIGATYPCEPSTKGMVLGQDIFFLGFPYGLTAKAPDSEFPLPLVKKGTLSRFHVEDGVETVLLDGINNAGFSGGPAVFYSPGNPNDIYIAGVVSGYRYNEVAVHVDGIPTEAVVRENTGLIVVYTIGAAVRAAEASELGVLLR